MSAMSPTTAMETTKLPVSNGSTAPNASELLTTAASNTQISNKSPTPTTAITKAYTTATTKEAQVNYEYYIKMVYANSRDTLKGFTKLPYKLPEKCLNLS
jgi:hypothetical protein